MPKLVIFATNLLLLLPITVSEAASIPGNGTSSKTVVKALDGVYVALNFGLSNVIMLEGTDGIILVDTSESSFVIAEVMERFRNITSKPLKAIVITHFHADHTRGIRWLLENEKKNFIEIFAHRSTEQELLKSIITTDGTFRRAVNQFGIVLPPSIRDTVSGPKLRFGGKNDISLLHATRVFDDKLTATVAGLTLQLLHIPSETVDQIAVWLPRKQALLSADIVYNSFPNIFTLRGETARSSFDWYKSIDRLRSLRAKYLIPNHTPPLSDPKEISAFLTNYRDAIQFVNDQTTRLFNRRIHVDEIVRRVKLPSTLANLPYMVEFYGTVEWAVRSIHSNYSGWFHGKAQELFPLSEQERANKLKEMMNSTCTGSPVSDMVTSSQNNAMKSSLHFNATGRYLYVESQWAVEVANLAQLASEAGSAEHERAKAAKRIALQQMSGWTTSINAKYYFLSTAFESKIGGPSLPFNQAKDFLVGELQMHDLLPLLSLAVDSSKCDPTDSEKIWLHLSDIRANYMFILRNCILEFVSDKKLMGHQYDAKVSTTSRVVRSILNHQVTGTQAYFSGDVIFKGNLMSLKKLNDSLVPEMSMHFC